MHYVNITEKKNTNWKKKLKKGKKFICPLFSQEIRLHIFMIYFCNTCLCCIQFIESDKDKDEEDDVHKGGMPRKIYI